MLDEVKESKDKCDVRLGAARVKVGLTVERYGSESLDHEMERKNIAKLTIKE
jgi:hypothetical protein